MITGVSIQASSFAKSGEELTARLRKMGFHQMIRQEMAYFDDHKNSTGALTTRLATDASRVKGATGMRIGIQIQNVCALGKFCFTNLLSLALINNFDFLGVALGIAFYYGWQLTLLTLCFVPFMIIAGVIMMKLLTGQVL